MSLISRATPRIASSLLRPAARSVHVEARIEQLKLALPTPGSPKGQQAHQISLQMRYARRVVGEVLTLLNCFTLLLLLLLAFVSVVLVAGNYVQVVRSGNQLFLAGHLPQPAGGGALVTGKVGKDLTVEQGYEAAKLVALNLIATLKRELGDLDKVERIVKLVGFVNCTDGFAQQPQVVNGASDTLAEVFGDKGKHARSAVGTNALPLNVAVEIEAIVQFRE